MKKKVTIIDYEIGNLFSIKNAFRKFDADIIICNTEDDILSADRLILPGVGGFKEGNAGFKKTKIDRCNQTICIL